MPRFFFHVTDGFVENDVEGTELPDRAAARAQAIMLAGENLRDSPHKVQDTQDLRVEVTDERGQILFSVVTQLVNSPALARQIK